MNKLLIVPLMAAMIGCAATPEEQAANKYEVRLAAKECNERGGLVVLEGSTRRAKQSVICADEHMMAMWRSEGANCARLGGKPNFYGNYKGMAVIYSSCDMPYKPFKISE